MGRVVIGTDPDRHWATALRAQGSVEVQVFGGGGFPGVPDRECPAGGPPLGVWHLEGMAQLSGECGRAGREPCGQAEDLTQYGQVADDQWDAGGESFHRGETEALVGGREGEGVGVGDKRGQVVVGNRAEDHRLHAELRGAGLEPLPVVPVVEESLAAGNDQAYIRVVYVQQRVRLQEVQ